MHTSQHAHQQCRAPVARSTISKLCRTTVQSHLVLLHRHQLLLSSQHLLGAVLAACRHRGLMCLAVLHSMQVAEWQFLSLQSMVLQHVEEHVQKCFCYQH